MIDNYSIRENKVTALDPVRFLRKENRE